MRAPLSFVFTTVPADSGNVYPLDSTIGLIGTAAAAPGSFRNRWDKGRVTGSIKNGDKAITVTFECLTGVAGTSGDWETDATAESNGVFTVAANTTKAISWLPPTSDYRIKVTAGSDNPSFLTCRLGITWDRSAGAV